MTRNEKDTINRRTENRHLLQRMKAGLAAVKTTPHKRVLLVAYLVGAVLVWLFRAYLFDLDTGVVPCKCSRKIPKNLLN